MFIIEYPNIPSSHALRPYAACADTLLVGGICLSTTRVYLSPWPVPFPVDGGVEYSLFEELFALGVPFWSITAHTYIIYILPLFVNLK